MQYKYLSAPIFEYLNSNQNEYLEIISSFNSKRSNNRYIFNPEINKQLKMFIANTLSSLLKEEPKTLDELFIFKHYLRDSFLYFINKFEKKEINDFKIEPLFNIKHYQIPFFNDDVNQFECTRLGLNEYALLNTTYELISRNIIYTKLDEEQFKEKLIQLYN
jgi:hypothetical protein